MPETIRTQAHPAIDRARFVFSLLIVAFHFPPFQAVTLLSKIADFVLLRYLERLAVPFFFICSGFFLYRGIKWSSDDAQREKDYFFRIIRLYLIWTVIYLPYSINGFFYDEAGLKHAVVIYLRDFIFTGSCFHLWFLNALSFSVFLIMFLRKHHFPPRAILLISLFLFLGGLTAQSWFGIIKPLENFLPGLWKVLRKAGKLIVTTRNGLFEGFFYTAVGMLIALRNPVFQKKTLVSGFILSLVALLVEILTLRGLGWSRGTDIYLFQAPAVIFFFLTLKESYNQKEKVGRKLRKMSGLVYYIHPLTGFLIETILIIWNSTLVLHQPLFFAIVLLFSLIISAVILRLSEKWLFLKKLYE